MTVKGDNEGGTVPRVCCCRDFTPTPALTLPLNGRGSIRGYALTLTLSLWERGLF